MKMNQARMLLPVWTSGASRSKLAYNVALFGSFQINSRVPVHSSSSPVGTTASGLNPLSAVPIYGTRELGLPNFVFDVSQPQPTAPSNSIHPPIYPHPTPRGISSGRVLLSRRSRNICRRVASLPPFQTHLHKTSRFLPSISFLIVYNGA